MNIAARLQGVAAAGEVVLSEDVYRSVADDHADLAPRTVMLRGRSEPVEVRVVGRVLDTRGDKS
ncbi:MAG: hypothetical protein HYU87_02600 [Chloroflexi bacterium]|nr:hypothetical protein [Chloroflexota bacterium]